jgi:hypothetical protein
MDDRIREEFNLLQEAFPQAVYQDRWVMLPDYPLPGGWSAERIAVAFFLKPPYPANSPYGIYVPPGLKFDDKPPNNYAAAGEQVPFPGAWWVFSWQAEQWFPGATAADGHNMRTFALGISRRFLEGV